MSNEEKLLAHPVFQSALPILHRLEEAGFETVFVGGCVRDLLAGRDISDVDIATAATPEQVVALFEHVIPTGLQHGTVTVVEDGTTYEITTFRKESAYEAYRKPSGVEFISDLSEDLRRRDYTINAMAVNRRGQLFDPFGGWDDLRGGRVRCVGNADARLQEDALRMLRGIRFAAEFGTGDQPIESATWTAMLRHRMLLQHIAMERVGAELHKMVKGRQPDQAVRLLLASGLLKHTKETLPLASEAAWTKWRQYTESHEDDGAGSGAVSQPKLRLSEVKRPVGRWAAICLACGLDEQAAGLLMHALRYSRQQGDDVVQLVSLHRRGLTLRGQGPEAWRRQWTQLVLAYGVCLAQWWLELLTQAPALSGHTAPAVRGIRGHELPSEGVEQSEAYGASLPLTELQRVMDELPVHSLKQLAVNGSDVMQQLSLKPGPRIRALLQELLLLTALGEVPNEHGELLLAARRLIEKEWL